MPVRKAAGRDPEIPEGINAGMLDKAVRHELSGLSREVAVQTGAHLAAANYFIESDPELAWEHAVAAVKRGARLGVVRETAGLAAYRTGRYADALAELRTARRITGSNEHLPVMADCERGLERPERALELAHSAEAKTLTPDGKIELKIVESGARADMGEYEAAVVVLQIPELESSRRSPSLARLRFAYSEALKAAKRHQEADSWRSRAIAEDPDGEAGVNDVDEDDLEVIDLEWNDDEDGDAEGVVDGLEDDAEDSADDVEDGGLAGDKGGVDVAGGSDVAGSTDVQGGSDVQGSSDVRGGSEVEGGVDDDGDLDDEGDENADGDEDADVVDAGAVENVGDADEDDADDADEVEDDDADDVAVDDADVVDEDADDDLDDDEDDDLDDEDDDDSDDEDDDDDDLDDEDDVDGAAPTSASAAPGGSGSAPGEPRGSAFDMRFEHGGREDADKSADRQE